MIFYSFVYQIMVYKHVTYHIIFIINKSYLEHKKLKSIDKKDP